MGSGRQSVVSRIEVILPPPPSFLICVAAFDIGLAEGLWGQSEIYSENSTEQTDESATCVHTRSLQFVQRMAAITRSRRRRNRILSLFESSQQKQNKAMQEKEEEEQNSGVG